MGFLRSSHNNPAVVPHYTGLQIQTSSNAVPIAVIWGTAKIAPNVIWTGGFYSVAQYNKQGGKGGGGGGQQLQGYEYFTSFAMGICEGPIGGFGKVWVGQGVYGGLYGTGITFSRFGSTPQAPWPYLAIYGQQSLGYNGLAYIAANNFDLGSSPVLPQFSLEVFGFFTGSAIQNTYDADPALVVQDFLTSSQYGVGFPAASIDATTLFGLSGATYQAYCRAAFLAFSPALINQESANSILGRWLQLTNTAAVWSGGKLKFVPYGDISFSGNGATFTPNVAPIYNLTDDDFIHEDGKDPLEVTRSDPYASYNWQRLNVTNRYNNYDTMPVDAFDQNAIELYGLRMAPEITATEFCDPNLGALSARLILQRQLYIRNIYQFKLSFEYCLLEPMDLVTVTDSGLGLTNVAVRITSIEEDEDGLLGVTAEEFPVGIATAVQYPTQPAGSNPTNQAVVPARVNPPVIYEPPPALTNNVPQIWAAVSAGIATAYLLAEDGSAGQHYTKQGDVAPVQANGTAVTFSVYAQALTRSAMRLNFFNGSANIGCDFNLATGLAGTPDPGISSVAMTNAGGGASSPVTISIASPAAVTWTANGLQNGQAIIFSTTGTLPAGLTAGTVYYVVSAAVDTFMVAATPGGAAINTSGSQSGEQTCTADIWYRCSITGSMAAQAAPTLFILLENPVGTTSYAGVSGNGIYIWGAEVSFGSEAPKFLPAFLTVVGATLATSGVAKPQGAAGVADPNWGGAFVWISADNSTYGQIGAVSAPSRQGVLTASLPAPPGANPDTTNTLSVSLIKSGGQLANATQADAQNGVTLCLVDNELLAYGTATLTGTNAYNLTYLYRGLHGTSAVAHLSAAPFARLDDAVFKYNLPAAFIGVTLYMKFQSFNIFGRSVEDLSECAVYTYTPIGIGQPLGPVTQALVNGTSLDFRLVSEVVSQTDQWGTVTDGLLLASVDLGAGIP
ncbi:MAG: phage tail protein [Methylocella sp.]